MSIQSFEIRVCQNPECGLRYPLTEGHPFGERCPLCLGETVLVLKKKIERESNEERERKDRRELAVLVDNVRSAWNVGSILRTSDGFGFSHVFLCGITPTPEQAEVRKTALGAEQFVTWSHHKDAVKLVEKLKQEGWRVWALEFVEGAVPIRSAEGDEPKIVLIVGSEVTGVDPGLLALTDQIVYLPMHGQKRSFNVAVAFGAAAFALNQ
ncbi:MAG: TrmH family RNA methyltransferase [Chloroflexi bacterium]|nr:TrmH family RNA methyltransferase [Chloroflexota bacterium]